MTRLAALLLAAALPCSAQELVTVVEPEERVTSRVIFLVDTSGSMKPAKLPTAIEAALKIARQGGDELEISAFAFAAGYCRWPAPQQEGGSAPPAWASMPDEQALVHLLAWLQAPVVSDSGTALGPCLARALAEERDELTVIVLTDGLLDDAAELLAVLEDGQIERERKGLSRAVVACLGVGSEAPPLRALAEAGRGGYWRVPDPPRPPAPPGPFPPVQGYR